MIFFLLHSLSYRLCFFTFVCYDLCFTYKHDLNTKQPHILQTNLNLIKVVLKKSEITNRKSEREIAIFFLIELKYGSAKSLFVFHWSTENLCKCMRFYQRRKPYLSKATGLFYCMTDLGWLIV